MEDNNQEWCKGISFDLS